MHDVKRYEMYGAGKFLRIYDEVRESIAYLVLPPAAREVLLDWIGVYNVASSYNRSAAFWQTGIKYTWSMCRVPISKRSFHRALVELKQKGWIVDRDDMIAIRGDACILPSHKWQDYQPTLREQKRVREHVEKRERYARNDAQIEIDFTPAEMIPSSRNEGPRRAATSRDNSVDRRTSTNEGDHRPPVMPELEDADDAAKIALLRNIRKNLPHVSGRKKDA